MHSHLSHEQKKHIKMPVVYHVKTSASIPDEGLINGVGALSQGKHLRLVAERSSVWGGTSWSVGKFRQ